MAASPEPGSEKHRAHASEVFRTLCAWDAISGAAESFIVRELERALARVEAETRERMDEEMAALRAEVERLRTALIESDAVIAGHWHSHGIDGSTWRLHDQARPVQDAIRRYEERGGAAGWDLFCRQRAEAENS